AKLAKNAFPFHHRVTDPDAATSTLLTEAAKKALAKAEISAADLSLLICVTDTPDFVLPATASRVQHGIGPNKAPFFDMNSSCAGLTQAVTMAGHFLRGTPDARYVLIVSGNLYSRLLDPKDLWSQLFFSDSGGALVLKAEDVPGSKYGIEQAKAIGDGQYWWTWGLYAGGTWKGFGKEALEAGQQYIKIVNKYPDGFNVEHWPPVIREVLAKTGWEPGDVDRLFLTQSSP